MLLIPSGSNVLPGKAEDGVRWGEDLVSTLSSGTEPRPTEIFMLLLRQFPVERARRMQGVEHRVFGQ
jgi:hypothetical protein